MVFVSSVVGLCMHLIHTVVAGLGTADGSDLNASVWVPLFIVSCLCVMSILQAAAIGKSIGGALCTSGASAMVGGFVGGLVGSSAIAQQAYGKTLKGPVDYARNKFKQAASASSASKLYQSIRRGGA